MCTLTPASTAYTAYAREAIRRDNEDRLALKSAYFCVDAINKRKLKASDVKIANEIENNLNLVYANIVKKYRFEKSDYGYADMLSASDELDAFYAQEELMESGVSLDEVCAKDLKIGINLLRKYADIKYSEDVIARLIGLSPNAETVHIYSSEEMLEDRRQTLYENYCVDMVKKFFAQNNKNFDPIPYNKMMSELMNLYVEIVRQEYDNDNYSKEFITGKMQEDWQHVKTRLMSQGLGECKRQVIGDEFLDSFNKLLNKYAKTSQR